MLGTVVTVVASIVTLAYWLGRKFVMIEERFRVIDERFRMIDERFNMMEERFKSINERFRSIDERFREIDNRFEEISKRLDRIEKKLEEHDRRFEDLEKRVKRVVDSFTAYQEFFVEYLASEGVIPVKSRSVLLAEIKVFKSFALANPLTREEWEKIARYIDKDPETFTMEEAEEFLELARKVVEEYGDMREAWKLHIYAALVKGWTIKRLSEEEEKRRRKEQSS